MENLPDKEQDTARIRTNGLRLASTRSISPFADEMMSNLLPEKKTKVTKVSSEYSHKDLRKKLICLLSIE